MANKKLTSADIVMIVLYFVGVVAIGLWSVWRSKRNSVSGYFLAGRFMTFLPVGMSLFASNIGSEHFIGLAGSGAAAGIGVGAFEFNALLLLQLLGFVFLPVYIASGVYTLPEYIHKRFGGNRIRVFLALLSLLLYIFTKISVNMYSGALFIQQSAGWDLYWSVLLLVGLTGICTVTGGLAAVIYLDTFMGFLMVGGATIMTIIGFNKVGGYSGLRVKYMNAIAAEVLAGNTTAGCGIPKADSFIMLRDPVNSDLPWPGFLLGQTPASIWYWCADQVIVQRALAAKSLSHAQGGAVLAGYIKILPLFVMVMPGMISRVLFPDEVGCVDPDKCMAICQSRSGCSNIAYPKLVLEIMPSGLRGLMLAVTMAALMSDLTSIFNSASTLFTLDIWKRMRHNASTRELMIVGRVFVVVMCVIGIMWVPIIKELQGGQLFIYIQAISAYLAPPIAAIYLIAIFWKRSNEKGAFYGLLAGFVAGIVRMTLDFVYESPICGQPDTRPAVVKNFHYMYFALLLFVLTGAVCIIVSLLTKPVDDEKLVRTTFWTRHNSLIRSDEIEEEKEMEENDAIEQRARSESRVSHRESIPLDERKASAQEATGADNAELVTFTQIPRWQRVLDLVCGLTDDVEEERQTVEEQRAHLREVISLRQSRRAKQFLRVNLAVILVVALVMYIYFSVPDGGPTAPTIHIPKPRFNKTTAL